MILVTRGAAKSIVGPGQIPGQGKLLDLSCFGIPSSISKSLLCKLQITVLKNWFGCQKKRASIHCDKYTPYSLFVTKDKPTDKEDHLDYYGRRLRHKLSIVDMFEFQKRGITLEPLCQASNKYMMNIYSS